MSRTLSTLWLSSFFTLAAFLLLMPAARSKPLADMVPTGFSAFSTSTTNDTTLNVVNVDTTGAIYLY